MDDCSLLKSNACIAAMPQMRFAALFCVSFCLRSVCFCQVVMGCTGVFARMKFVLV